MNFGILNIVRNPTQWHRPDHELYKRYFENAVRAEELGFTHIWFNEHHFRGDGLAAPSPMIPLAAVAARTEKIRIGTYVFLLPLHNPIRAAEDAAALDIISNGRLDLGLGFGPDVEESRIFGIQHNQRRGRLYEGIDILRRCFAGEEFSYHGKYHQFDKIRMTTTPVQKPLPMWLGAQDNRSLRDAGARGIHLAIGPTAEQEKVYESALREAGYDPNNFQRAMFKMVHVAETGKKAWDEAEPHLRNHMIWHVERMKLKPAQAAKMDLSVPALGELRKSGRGPYGPPAIGSPDEVIAHLEQYFRTTRLTEFCFTPGFAGMDPDAARRSMELFAKEVMPHFRNR